MTLRRLVRDESGQLSAFVAVIMLALIACAGLVLDGGLALDAKTRALDAAQEAARAGAQAVDIDAVRSGQAPALDPTAARDAALASLAASGVHGTVVVTGDRVTVTVTHDQNTQVLQVVGVDKLTVTATATATLRKGVIAPDPYPGAP